MKEIKEITRNQRVFLTTEISREKFDILKNAKDADAVVSIERKLGENYFFKGQTIYPSKIDFGYHILLTCSDDEVMCVFDRGSIHKAGETIIKHDIFNAKFFGTKTVVNNLLPRDEN